MYNNNKNNNNNNLLEFWKSYLLFSITYYYFLGCWVVHYSLTRRRLPLVGFTGHDIDIDIDIINYFLHFIFILQFITINNEYFCSKYYFFVLPAI